MTTNEGTLFLDLVDAGLKFVDIQDGKRVRRKEYEQFNELQTVFDQLAKNINDKKAQSINMGAIFGDLLTQAASLERKDDRVPFFILLNRALIAMGGDVRYGNLVSLLNDSLSRMQQIALQAS